MGKLHLMPFLQDLQIRAVPHGLGRMHKMTPVALSLPAGSLGVQHHFKLFLYRHSSNALPARGTSLHLFPLWDTEAFP